MIDKTKSIQSTSLLSPKLYFKRLKVLFAFKSLLPLGEGQGEGGSSKSVSRVRIPNCFSLSGIKHYAPLLLIVLFGLLVRIWTIGFATNVDEGDYLMQGRELMRGYWPHLDVHLNKPPLVSFLAYPFFWLGDVPIIPARVFMILLSASSLIAIFLLGRELLDERAGVFAAGWLAFDPFFAIWSKYLHVSTLTPCLELWAVTLFLLSFKYNRKLFPILSGLFTALCLLNKQTGVIILPVLVGLLLCYRKQTNVYSIGKWFFAGFLPIPLLFGVMLVILGAVEPFLYDVLFSNFAMAEVFDFTVLRRWAEFRSVTHWNPLAWYAALVGIALAAITRNGLGLTIAFWWALEFGVNLFALSHVWQHYVMAIMPPAFILGGLCCSWIIGTVMRFAGNKTWPRFATAALVLLATALFWNRANWAYPNMTLEDERSFAAQIERTCSTPYLLCFVNTSYYLWTGKDVPPSVRGDRQVRIPPFMNTAARGYLNRDDMKKTVALWETLPMDTCLMYGKYYRHIFEQNDPLLEDVRLFFEMNFEWKNNLEKNIPTYYAHIMVFKRK